MVRANVFACLCLALGAGVSADDLLSKIVSTGEKAVVNADAGKVVADAGKAIANANAGKVVADAEKVAAKAAVTESVAVGTEKKKDTQTAVVVESTPSNEKTTKAVLKAVTDAEEKTETKEEKKATAVVDATMNVLKTESTVEKAVAPQVIAKAKEDAKQTFEKFDEAKVGTKASADAAAKVALAEIDGASGKKLNKEVEANAEKAAVAAGKGVADHPKRSCWRCKRGDYYRQERRKFYRGFEQDSYRLGCRSCCKHRKSRFRCDSWSESRSQRSCGASVWFSCFPFVLGTRLGCVLVDEQCSCSKQSFAVHGSSHDLAERGRRRCKRWSF